MRRRRGRKSLGRQAERENNKCRGNREDREKMEGRMELTQRGVRMEGGNEHNMEFLVR